ncbi:MAG: TipAS antibiotic-recognition domain-containing protein [Bryobacterales bacterium]|nr:TipAS antibiotic-recognition domain-containing protein [Bryobacterales bacterium]MBV9397308.1 TipAS antibiotic-recognition domain-containing protein [Bryobacterales bacterium]
MIEPYYTREQAEALHKLREAAGGEGFDRAWTKLIADVRADMDSGGGPSTDRAKALGQRWRALVEQFTGGDVEIERLLYQAADKYRVNCEQSGFQAPNVVGYIRTVLKTLDV